MKPRVTLYILNPEAIAILGKVTDKEFANRFNCCEATAGNLRRKHRLPSINARSTLTPEIFASLGKKSDSKVAKEHNLCEATVKRWRKKHGIKAKGTR